MPSITVDLWHDTICPWCRIGHRHLETALETWTGPPVNVVYHPFLLDPSMPPEGADLRQRLAAKYGADRLDGMFTRVTEVGRSVGLTFRFDAITRTPNTLRSHALLEWAPAAKHTGLLKRIHISYFEAQGDIGSVDHLAELAALEGLDADAARAAVADPARLDAVRAAVAGSRSLDIRGVPHFRIAAEVVHGAQPAPVLHAALQRASGG